MSSTFVGISVFAFVLIAPILPTLSASGAPEKPLLIAQAATTPPATPVPAAPAPAKPAAPAPATPAPAPQTAAAAPAAGDDAAALAALMAVGDPDGAALKSARTLVGYARIDTSARAIAFLDPGMSITLNGIAQGYITDRIADLLRQEGFEHAMVELGETRALGAATDGRPFAIGLRDPQAPDRIGRTIEIADQAVSVSGGYGMRFGASLSHHIFDPATGLSARRLLDVTVIAPRATSADALSTAIYVAGEDAAPKLLAAYPAARAMLTRLDGSVATL